MAEESRSPAPRVLFELGRGGMGSVFLALSTGAGGFSKLKVVKQLRPELASDGEFVAMFLDEARTTARLDHDNIVKTYEVGFDGVGFSFSMEYLEGLSLDRVARGLAKRGMQLPRELAAWSVSQVLAGLHHAHEHTDLDGAPLSIVHRDVSPHNVFVTFDGSVKLLDFGIAKAADSAVDTRTGDIKGKTRYLAPEQAARGAPVDRRADVFAAGIVLYELVTAQRFWGELLDGEVFARLAAGELPSARATGADVPEELDRIICCATARVPDRRYPTAAAMQADLEAFVAGQASRVGPRPMAALMAFHFASERALARKRVEEAIRGAREGAVSATTDDAETLRAAGSEDVTTDATATAPLAAERVEEPILRAPPPAAAPRPAPRARAKVALTVAVGLALVAGAWGMTRSLPRTTSTEGGATVPVADAHLPGCVADRDCTPAMVGGHAICRADLHRCASLESAECRVVGEASAFGDARTLWVGTMFPTSGPGADQNARVYERGVLLAHEDFTKVTHGLPPLDGVGEPRPIGIVACDSTRDPAAVGRHLVEDVGVPAIIGFSASDTLIALAGKLFIPEDVLAVSVSDGSAYVSKIAQPKDQPRLVWRTTMDTWGMARPAARLITQIVEPELRQRHVVDEGAAVRVALVREDSLVGLSTSDAIGDVLRVNERSALQNGADFADVIIKRDDLSSYATAVSRLLALAPHVVVYAARDEQVSAVLAPLEAHWPKRARHRPVYVEDTTLGGRALFDLFRSRPDVRKRTFGMYGPLETAANLRFTKRWAEGAEVPLPYTQVPGSAYDGFYLLTFALFLGQGSGSAGTPPLRGSTLARQIPRLMPPGELVEVGPGKIFDVLDILRRGGNADLVGTASNLDFDARTGDTMGNVVLDCARPSAATFESQEIAVTYSAATLRWTGKLACPW